MFFRIPPAVKNLIIINVLMLLVSYAFSNYNISLDIYMGLFYYQSPYFHLYQYITYMFMHGGFLHLFFNMYALFLFGSALEQVWGSKRFLIFYFVTGVGAAAFYTLINHFEYIPMIKAQHAFINTPSPDIFRAFLSSYFPDPDASWIKFMNQFADAPKDAQLIKEAVFRVNLIVYSHFNVPCVGASGAVYGVLLGFGMLFPNTQLMLIFPPIPIKAKYVVMFYGGLELYLGITQPGSQVAHVAHIGGMIFGYFMIKLWNKDRRNFY